MGGLIGRLFREFSMTVAIAILLSAVVSLTLTPMLCSRFLREHEVTKHGRLYREIEGGFAVVLAVYQRTLRCALQHYLLRLIVAAAALGAPLLAFLLVPTGFIPPKSAGLFCCHVQSPAGLSIYAV